jgi:DNA-binding NtrC family response regulator
LTKAESNHRERFPVPREVDDAPRSPVLATQVGDSDRTDSNLIPVRFDPTVSYGQTRAAFTSEFEVRYVSWLLDRQHGNLSAASREARMDRKHLHDLAKKHGLRRPNLNRHS